MINLRLARFILLYILLNGCNKINPDDLTVIDGIKLGTTFEELNGQFDSLKMKERVFYTQMMFNEISELSQNKIKAYTTDIFDLSQHHSLSSGHCGIYYPITIMGTNNVKGLNVLLVHTDEAALLSNVGLTYLTKGTNISGISQDISNDLVDNIENMLTSKYGKSTYNFKSQYSKFFVIEGNQIKDYHSDNLNVGEMAFWETKYLLITLFKGIRSTNSTFNSKQQTYITYFKSDPDRVIKYETGERPCRSFCYISYELKDKVIKELGLDKPKL